MPPKLTTTISKIYSLSNPTNARIIDEFHRYMKYNAQFEIQMNQQFNHIMSVIKQNPKLAQIKPKVLTNKLL